MNSIIELRKLLDEVDLKRAIIAEQLKKYEQLDSEYHISITHNVKKYFHYTHNLHEPFNIAKFYEEGKEALNFNKRYHLITFTFDPSKVKEYRSEINMQQQLIKFIEKFNELHYYACLEKHQNEILHAHMLVCGDPFKLKEICEKWKKITTPRRQLYPSINIKPVERTCKDVLKSYAYIFNHKKDHPVYKDLIINI